ncbi:hypothetical protein [Oscillatoria salina]|uniref:hypothetical protein n=1 Tax=Oscillatoria salina TaxID=331517 RepID=UPI001CCCF1E9|nr:hypothetical protein [Oscillatoria salina]MBZ8182101.1 hypothetical protein [Oscillatoria salina IIICB1]
MCKDEILAEIHRIREEHAKSFNYDLDAIFADLVRKQAASGRRVVSLQGKSGEEKLAKTNQS